MSRGLDWYFKLQDRISGPARGIVRALGSVRAALSATGRAAATVGRAMGVAAAGGARAFARAGMAAATAARDVGRAAIGMGTRAVAVGAVGLGLLARSVASVGGNAESTQIALAGMLQAGNVTGGGAAGFQRAMGMTSTLIDQMRRDARDLPGTFEDLMNVFRGGLSGGLAAGKTPDQIRSTASQLMAVTSMLGIDSEQAGRDFGLMMAGRAGAQVATFSRLAPQIGMTAEAFNQLSRAQRFERIQQALSGYGPAVRAFSNSWEAISSTAKDHAQTLFRVGTADLFGRMKSGLAGVNAWFEANQESAERLARTVGGRLASGFDRAVGFARGVPGMIGAARGSAVGQALSSSQGRSTAITAGASVAGLAMGIPGLGLLAGVVMAIASNATVVDNVLRMLPTVMAPVLGALTAAEEALATLFVGLLPGLMGGIREAVSPLVGIFQRLRPHLEPLGEALGRLLMAVGRVIGGLFTALEPILGPAVDLLTALVDIVAKVVDGLRSLFGILPGESGPAGTVRVGPSERQNAAAASLFGGGPSPTVRAGSVVGAARPQVNVTLHTSVDAGGAHDAGEVAERTANEQRRSIGGALEGLGFQLGR
jgi:hypothetical protein